MDRLSVSGARPEPERAVDIGRALVPSELELGYRGATPLERTIDREAEVEAGDRGDERGLVVAAMSLAFRVDGYRDDDLRTDADVLPATRDRGTERLGESTLARVLELVERGADGAGERCAPLDLEQRCRDVGRHTDRDAARQLEPGIESGTAVAAQWLAFAAAAGASGRERKIEGGAGDAGDGCHRWMVAAEPSLSICTRGADVVRGGRKVRERYSAATVSSTTESPTAVPVRSIVPTGSSSTPSAPRIIGTSPVQGRRSR